MGLFDGVGGAAELGNSVRSLTSLAGWLEKRIVRAVIHC